MNRPRLQGFAAFLLLVSIFSISLPLGASAQTAAVASAQPDLKQQLAGIEEKVEKRRKELGIPGMALAIVKDGQVIYLKGLGYKDLEKKLAVTPDTQFAIGSATKAFTALTALMSADEGKLSLDDSPKKYLSYFKINNPETDAKITVRDLMSHSSGLNRTDLAMITGKLTREELIRVAGEAKPVAGLHEKFMYQNLMFTAAGEIVSVVQKKPYEQVIQERILTPLGMTNTSLAMRQMEKAKDFSLGYNYDPETGETSGRPFRDMDAVAPAGAINSSARDMAEWVRFVLNGGAVNGKRLVSEKNYEEWLKPQMKIGANSDYGLGWFLDKWNGLKVVQHGGNIDGFNSMVAMIPEKKLGFVMLTNVSASTMGAELMPIVWQGILGSSTPEDSGKLPVKTMEKMVGKYLLELNKMEIEVKIDGDHLVMIAPQQPTYTLERTAPRQFKIVGGPDGFAAKFMPEQGDATVMTLQQPNGNFTLYRINPDGTLAKPAVASSGPNPAKELIGRYEPVTGTVAVEVREDDGKILLNIPGRPAPFEVKLKEKDIYSLPPFPEDVLLKVKRSAEGKIDGFELGTSIFKYAGVPQAPGVTTDEFMAKAIAAAGGESNIRKITSRVSTFEIDLQSEGVKQSGTSYAKAPNKVATDFIYIALGKKIGAGFDYFDGAGGQEEYSFAPVADTFSGQQLEDVKFDADFYAMLEWKSRFKKIDVAGIVKVSGEDCYQVNFEPQVGSKYTEYYSSKTFLPVRREGAQRGTPYNTVFSDYREVDGIKIPFKTTNSSPMGNTVTEIKDVKHNVEISDEVFKLKKL